ncbi:MAG: hypothetical protein L3J57_01590 [Desulfuromusa sp.]|nr:hypothetical protein [Desulfuromusa sp.]
MIIIQLVLLLLCPALLWSGQGMYPVPMVYQVAGSVPVTVSDNFEGDLSAWTIVRGSWDIVAGGPGDNYLSSSVSNGVISYNTSIGSINQWVLVVYKDIQYAGAYFRFTGSDTAPAYAVGAKVGSTIAWQSCTGDNCTTIDTWSHTVTPGSYIGAEIAGTDTETICRMWDFGQSPPADRDSWGIADFISTADPVEAADTGQYIGLYSGSTETELFDNFSGGGFLP